jgi:hypothetical protein
MSLMVPHGPGFTFEVDNLTGTPSSATPGTNFTFGGSSADGTAVEILGALARDVCYVEVECGGCDTGGEDNSALADLLVDPAGGSAWANLAANLVAGAGTIPTQGTRGFVHRYSFPIWISAGSTVGWRARKAGATASTNGYVVIRAYGEPRRPETWWCGTGIESLGITEASSKGTAHTPGNTGTYSAYAAVGTTTRRYGALQLGVNSSDATMLGVGYYWQMGAGGVQLAGTPTLYVSGSTAEIAYRVLPGTVWVDVASGTELQVRATCSGTAEAWDVGYYGVF